MIEVPMLSVILFLPLLGAVGAVLLPRRAGWGWALATALADLGCCIWLVTQFNASATGFQFSEHYPWLPDLGINYALGVNGINLFLVGLNALLTVVAVGASWRVARDGARSREYFALMLLLSMGMQGVFLATNLFLFYVFWELMLVPAYLLVGIYGGPRRAYAAIKFVIYTSVGSLLMLIGIIAVGAVVSTNSHTAYTLDLSALLGQGVPGSAQVLLFLAFAAAFAVKVGLFPFHSWVPDAYREAPVPVVVLVAGVMAKTGAYGFVQFCLPLFPQASHQLAGLMEVLAVIGVLYFALEALVAQDVKQLLAYVSISHLGVIVLGIFALNVQGLEGGVLQMVNHGVIIAALFLIAGAFEERVGTRRLADFGGLAVRLPWLATVFLIVALAALGLPGLNSFAGEFLAFLGAFHANYAIGALGTLVVIPAAWYMLRFFQGMTEGPEPEGGPVAAALAPVARAAKGVALVDLRWGELLVLLPLLALIFYLGIFPGMVTLRMEQSVSTLPPITTPAAPTGAPVEFIGGGPTTLIQSR
ncbi:MAG TPA: NADH-quinone oxidoreductase subunit M [Ktedonobacterales bacterium]